MAFGGYFSVVIYINKKLTESNPCIVDTSIPAFKEIKQFFRVERKDCYEEGDKQNGSSKRNGWNEILSIRGMPTMYIIYFLIYLAFNLFSVALPIYASTQLIWTIAELGFFLAFYSFMMMIAQGPVLARISRYMNSINLMIAGAVFLCIGFGLLSGNRTLALYLAIAFMALGNGILWPNYLAVLSQMGTPSQRGTIQGYGASMGSMASMIGLILGGSLFDFLGTTVFMIGSGTFLLIIFILLFGFSSISLKTAMEHAR